MDAEPLPQLEPPRRSPSRIHDVLVEGRLDSTLQPPTRLQMLVGVHPVVQHAHDVNHGRRNGVVDRVAVDE